MTTLLSPLGYRSLSYIPDLEFDLHVEHAELIEAIEKDFGDDAEFPCCSCERLFQRKKSHGI